MPIAKDYVHLVDTPTRRQLTPAGRFWLGYVAVVTGAIVSLYFGGVVLAAAKRAGAIVDLQLLISTGALVGVIAAVAALYWSATGGESRD